MSRYVASIDRALYLHCCPARDSCPGLQRNSAINKGTAGGRARGRKGLPAFLPWDPEASPTFALAVRYLKLSHCCCVSELSKLLSWTLLCWGILFSISSTAGTGTQASACCCPADPGPSSVTVSCIRLPICTCGSPFPQNR